MPPVVRFAPSPTGYLHIGAARTALFNWLFARHHGGTFKLRIEDTDRQRSTEAAVTAIVEGLKWLELTWDGDVVFQFPRATRHAEVARKLLAEGKAYYCYASPQELEQMRAEQKAKGLSTRYDGRWRDRDPKEAPPGVKPVIRLKAPQTGDTVVKDRVQGEIKVANAQLDDMVLLRADGTPTYMHSVVVDDIDMGISHVIRGSDHMTNTFRQLLLYNAIGAPAPEFAHIPLIHGPDGAKLSKRHGALGVEAYRDMGYLPEAMRNYLLRLGWAHGDDEIISTDQAIQWFDLDGVGQSPARFDFTKLDSVNANYLRETPEARLAALVRPIMEKKLGLALDAHALARVQRGMPGLKQRAKNLVELADAAMFYVAPRPLKIDEKSLKLLTPEAKAILAGLAPRVAGLRSWDEQDLEAAVRSFAEAQGIGLGKVAQPLRAALTGSTASPGLFEVMAVLGREETLGRIADQAG